MALESFDKLLNMKNLSSKLSMKNKKLVLTLAVSQEY